MTEIFHTLLRGVVRRKASFLKKLSCRYHRFLLNDKKLDSWKISCHTQPDSSDKHWSTERISANAKSNKTTNPRRRSLYPDTTPRTLTKRFSFALSFSLYSLDYPRRHENFQGSWWISLKNSLKPIQSTTQSLLSDMWKDSIKISKSKKNSSFSKHWIKEEISNFWKLIN